MALKTADVLVRIKGDNKGLNKAVDGSKTKLGGLKAAAIAAGPAIAAAGVAAAAAFIGASVKMAAEEEAVTATTAALLEKQGIMWSQVGAETDAYLKKLERLTTFNDTDLQNAFNAMLATGTEYNTAMESMSTVTGLAAATGMDLASAGKMIGRALQGDVTILKRYGIEATATQDVMEVMNERFGDGSHQANSFEGQMRNLKNQLSNVMEAIGVELLPVTTDLLRTMADGAMFILPAVVKAFKLLLIPIKAVVFELKLMQMSLKAVWLAMKGEFAGAQRIVEDIYIAHAEYNEELLNTAKDLIGIKREQEDLNAEYMKHVALLDDVTQSQTELNESIDDGTKAASAASLSFDDLWKSQGNWISGSGEYVSAAKMGVSGSTRSSSGAVSSSSPSVDQMSGKPLISSSHKIDKNVFAKTPPSMSINIGTVNESSAGNVAAQINKQMTKSLSLTPW